MRFYIAPHSKGLPNGKFVYKRDEYSFDFVPASVAGFASLMVNDLNIEIDRNGKLLSVWGLCPYNGWKESVLNHPETINSDLFVKGIDIRPDVAVPINPDHVHLPVFADFEKGIVTISTGREPDFCVQIIPGAAVQISSRGEFCAIWLVPVGGLQDLELP